MSARRAVLALLLALLACAARAVPAGAASAASCSADGITATATPWATGDGWTENLSFDGRGGMWVSELTAGKIVRYDPSGQPGTSVAVSSPGATVLRADGTMDAVFGDSELSLLPGPGSGIETFDPRSAAPTAQPFASGLKMANGAALDAAGNLYVADTLTPGIVKLSPAGVADPAFTAATRISGADGLVVDGRTLYVTQLTSLGAAIVQVPLADPGQYTVLASLAPLVGPDDLTVGPDGALYAAMLTGQIVRVDRTTGAACVAADAGAPATSIRFAHAFPPYTASADAFVTSETGQIVHLHFTGLSAARTGGGTMPGPAAPAARMRLSLRPAAVRAGRTVSVRATVRAAVAACRAGVLVRVGAAHGRTGASGRVMLRTDFHHPGRIGAAAQKSGCTPATSTLRVLPAR